MDGLSGTASGMAVVSLAVQLGQSIKKLCDFWDSVKEAPDDIHAITTDLSLLLSVLAEMDFEEQHCGPDHTLNRVLEACQGRVGNLTQITNDMEPGFASTSLRIRKWTAFKAVLKGERIQKFQKVLDRLKMSLMLAQQSHHRRLDRIRYQSQQHDLTTIAKHLSSLQIEQTSATVSTITNSPSVLDEHTNALRGQASRICRPIRNPVHRVGFENGSNIAVQELATNLPSDQRTSSWPMPNPETDHSNRLFRAGMQHRARQQTSRKTVLSVQDYVKQTLFGAITTTTTTTRLLRPRLIDNEALDDEDYQFEHKTSLRILPAQWLLKLGFNYAYSVSTFDSSTQGWQWSIKPINLVPDDASIFKFCDQGEIEKVRDLISNNLASVRDVDSEGQTALHFAVRSHSPDLCRFLIEAGADKNAGTEFLPSPLMEIEHRSITEDGLVNAIDTCRIFEDSFDFWDEHGHGWYLLELHYLRSYGAWDKFFSWIIRSSSSDIKANFNVQGFRTLYDLGVREGDVIDSLLSLVSAKILDELEQVLPWPPLYEYILTRRWTFVNTLLAWGADPYSVHLSERISPVPESPLSLAMYSSQTFWNYRNALRKMYPNVEDIAREELKEGRPLLDAGWRIETLTALLALEFEPDREPEMSISRFYHCESGGEFTSEVRVQPFWQVTLESIKNGTYRQQRFLSDTQDEHPLSKRSHPRISNQDSLINATDGSDLSPDRTLQEDEAAHPDEESSTREDDTSSTTPDRKEVWCIQCWHYHKKTGHRRSRAISERQISDHDSSEDDFSPFLFNT